MKNLIIALALFCVAGVNAQTTKDAAAKTTVQTVSDKEQSAQSDVAALASFMTITSEQKELFLGLFRTKHDLYRESGELSDERKQIVANNISRKMESLMTSSEFDKLKSNTALFKKLVN